MVLPRVGHLVFQRLDEAVKGHGDHGPERRAHPVDPMFRVELARRDAGTEAAGGVETSVWEVSRWYALRRMKE